MAILGSLFLVNGKLREGGRITMKQYMKLSNRRSVEPNISCKTSWVAPFRFSNFWHIELSTCCRGSPWSAPPFAAHELLRHFLHRLHASTVGGARWGGLIGGWPRRSGMVDEKWVDGMPIDPSIYLCTFLSIHSSKHPSICLTTTCMATDWEIHAYFLANQQFTVALVLWDPTHPEALTIVLAPRRVDPIGIMWWYPAKVE